MPRELQKPLGDAVSPRWQLCEEEWAVFHLPGCLPPPPVSTRPRQQRGVWDGFGTSLFCFRIAKGLSEKVFAKSEEHRRTAEEDVEDAGRVKLLNHVDVVCIFGKFKLTFQIILYHHCPQLLTPSRFLRFHNPFTIRIRLSTFYSAHFLGLNWSFRKLPPKQGTLLIL